MFSYFFFLRRYKKRAVWGRRPAFGVPALGPDSGVIQGKLLVNGTIL